MIDAEHYLFAITRVLTDPDKTNSRKLIDIKKLLLLFYNDKRDTIDSGKE